VLPRWKIPAGAGSGLGLFDGVESSGGFAPDAAVNVALSFSALSSPRLYGNRSGFARGPDPIKDHWRCEPTGIIGTVDPRYRKFIEYAAVGISAAVTPLTVGSLAVAVVNEVGFRQGCEIRPTYACTIVGEQPQHVHREGPHYVLGTSSTYHL
jgi:hypothetical protein